jgi:TolB protein
LASAALAALAAAAMSQEPPPAGDVRQLIIGSSSQRIALPACVPTGGADVARQACTVISDVLRKDLEFEDVFQFVPESLLRAVPPLNPDKPNFDDWKAIDAQFLVTTQVATQGADLSVTLRLFYVESGQAMLARHYSGKADNPRLFAHQAADDMLEQIQYKGVARTKIVFTSDRDGVKGHPSKELYLMDYDGYNVRRVTVNRDLNILPTWSPDGRALAYVSFRQNVPDIFLAWIYEGRSQNVTNGKGRGQNQSPAFSPDGKRLAFASSRTGNMEIWVANIDGTNLRRITSNPAIDTAPCWSPTGQEIAFTSDRGGVPQIWAMDAEGLNVRRISKVGNYNDGAAWSPSREHPEIAYTSRIEGGFEIAVIDLASGATRQITEGRGACESPSWAPSGRHLTFACRRGRGWQINVSDRLGRRVVELPAGPGNNVQPEWGPFPR